MQFIIHVPIKNIHDIKINVQLSFMCDYKKKSLSHNSNFSVSRLFSLFIQINVLSIEISALLYSALRY